MWNPTQLDDKQINIMKIALNTKFLPRIEFEIKLKMTQQK